MSFAAYPADAAQYHCDGYVEGVTTGKGGTVYIASFSGSSWIVLCSLTTTFNNTSPEACKNVYAALLAAQLAGKRVRLWFDDSLTCSTQLAWNQAVGWYFGPEVLPD